jgi:hypothetical protein
MDGTMCDCLEGEDTDDAAELAVPLAELMERTRAVDARKSGDRVPDALWPVFFGLRSGSIPWAHHQRMVASRGTALAFLTARAAARRAGSRGTLCCTAETPDRAAFR